MSNKPPPGVDGSWMDQFWSRVYTRSGKRTTFRRATAVERATGIIGRELGDLMTDAQKRDPEPIPGVNSILTTGGTDIRTYSGNKYIRTIESCIPGDNPTMVDVYSVLVAFNVTNPAIAHALKKLLCAGIRGKGDTRADYTESIDAIRRAIDMLPTMV